MMTRERKSVYPKKESASLIFRGGINDCLFDLRKELLVVGSLVK